MVGLSYTTHQGNYVNSFSYSLSHEFVVILMSGSWQSHDEILQYVSNFLFAMFQKLLLQSLTNRLDVCKRKSSFLLFVVVQFLSQICLRPKEDLFFWYDDSGLFFLSYKFRIEMNLVD